MTIGALFLGGQIIDQNGTTPKIAEIANNEAWARTLFLSVEGESIAAAAAPRNNG